MDLFGIGTNELLVIAVLAVVILGPERLARSAREIGKLVRNFKAYFGSLTDELRSELDVLDDINKVKQDLGRK